MPKLNTIRPYLIYIPILLAIVKLFVGFSMELGNDEVYYFTYAQLPQLSYFDHGPLLGWTLWLFTLGGTLTSALVMRLPAILFCLLNSYIIYYWLKKEYSASVGLWAMLLYNANVYTGLIAGLFILPDSVQLTPWLLALYFMYYSIKHKELTFVTAVKIGLCVGFATLAKYHGLALWAGFLLFALVHAQWVFKKWQLYLSGAITILCCLPIVLWNIDNEFISFTFHNARVGSDGSINWTSFLQFNLGQIVYQNPVIWCLLIWMLVVGIKNRINASKPELLLLYIALPLILLPTISSLGKTTLPHWSGPAFIGLMILVAIILSQKHRFSFWVMLSLRLFLIAIVAFPFLVKSNLFYSDAKTDFRLDLYGWEQSAIDAKQALLDNGYDPENVVIVSPKWFPGGHLNFYWQAKHNIPVLVTGKRNDIHQFEWMNEKYPMDLKGKDLFLFSSERTVFTVRDLKEFTNKEQKASVSVDVLRDEKRVNRIVLVPLKQKKTTTFGCGLKRFRADSNRRTRFCRPLPSHSATEP